VYAHADPAHVEELLTCNESTFAVIVATESVKYSFTTSRPTRSSA
jgi:hypothetical protein